MDTKVKENAELSLAEFNIRFLLACQDYMAPVAIKLVRECHDDIVQLGTEATLKKWGKFVDI